MFKKKPFFIVFEGIEGSGKSYLSKKLYNNLKNKGFKIIKTREPGGTPGAERIRKLILKDYFGKNNINLFDKYTDTLLYLAARNEHIKRFILPKLLEKNIVICDRYIDSTYAYQIKAQKLDKKIFEKLNKVVVKNVIPKITFLIDIDPFI